MSGSRSADGVDRDLIAGWLAARSIARGLPAPVAEGGGWRVDTRGEDEWGRYVFPAIEARLGDLAHAIVRPRVFLKVCAPTDQLTDLLPPRWDIQPLTWVMTAGALPRPRWLPEGYRASVDRSAGAVHVSIRTIDRRLAASGHAAEAAGVFVYDRIVTEPGHRRRGLGGAVMTLLRRERLCDSSREVLVATDAGRALYTTFGWRVHSPYASAVIPDPAS